MEIIQVNYQNPNNFQNSNWGKETCDRIDELLIRNALKVLDKAWSDYLHERNENNRT